MKNTNSTEERRHLNGPDFIGIGAPRCGTTWLARTLAAQPSVFMPRMKELHYFDRSINYPSPNRLSGRCGYSQALRRGKEGKEARRFMVRALANSFLHHNEQSLSWFYRYFFNKINDSWYLSLFSEHPDKVRGEITPAYSMLTENDIQKVHRLLPKCKLIYMIRNPIEMAWSGLRRSGIHSKSENEIKCSLEAPAMALRTNYLETIRAWRKYYPSEKLLICFYDDLKERPDWLTRTICNYLNIEYDPSYSFSQKVNSSPEATLPDNTHALLAKHFRSSILQLSEEIGGHCKTWTKHLG